MSEIIPIDPFLEAEAAFIASLPLFSIDFIDLEAAKAEAVRIKATVAGLERSQIGHRAEGTHSHSQAGGTGR